MDLYQQYIHKSRYARYLPEQNRREHWSETVDRYIDFILSQVKESQGVDLSHLKAILSEAIVDLKVMPSMRAVMTAGEALREITQQDITVVIYPLMTLRVLMRQCTSSYVALG